MEITHTLSLCCPGLGNDQDPNKSEIISERGIWLNLGLLKTSHGISAITMGQFHSIVISKSDLLVDILWGKKVCQKKGNWEMEIDPNDILWVTSLQSSGVSSIFVLFISVTTDFF